MGPYELLYQGPEAVVEVYWILSRQQGYSRLPEQFAVRQIRHCCHSVLVDQAGHYSEGMEKNMVIDVDLEVGYRLELGGESLHVETVKGLEDSAGFGIRVVKVLFVSMPFWHCLAGSTT